ncbi:MAG TPA: class I SAM-dependent methyltransferase [Vicinamibacterales bacterium]|nr:class I SAM-dependent methyltransferase [Vicinamibacterales bacterium]
MAQTWDAADYAANARFVSDLGQPVLDLLAPRAGERILDVGCGDGALTQRLVQAGAKVVGVDPAPDFVAAAAARGIDARLIDAQALPFEREFDAVFTNAVLHWIPDLDAALRGVHRALKAGGRFVGECGGHGNVAAVSTALQAVARRHGVRAQLPWRYPTPDDFTARLISAGFRPVSVELIPRPTPLASGMAAWLRTFAGPIFEQLPASVREAALDETVELLRWSLCDEEGRWTADYVRLRFAAHAM